MANVSTGLSFGQSPAGMNRPQPRVPGIPGAGMQSQYAPQYAAWQAQAGGPNAVSPNNFAGYLQKTGALGSTPWGTVGVPGMGSYGPTAGSGYTNGSYGDLGGSTGPAMGQPVADNFGFGTTQRNGITPTQTGPAPFPGTGAPGMATPQTLGGLASGQAAMPSSIPNQNAPNYPLNVGAYANPAAGFAQDWANKGLQGAYAGAGDLLSGNAMRGITDYNQQMALNNVWNPAVQTAENQQQFGYGVNSADRNFAFQQQLANQTIPFQQQMQLAQLGMQGTQGQQGVQNLLATLLGQNALAAGQAAGTGTIGGANTITQAIQNALSQYLAQNTLNRVFPQSATG